MAERLSSQRHPYGGARSTGVLAVLVLLFLSMTLSSQEGGGSDDADAAKAAKAAKEEQARRQKIQDTFTATEIAFDSESGKVTLTYTFNEDNEEQGEDFVPDVNDVPKRMRWSRGWEGGYEGNWGNRGGVVVNKVGKWLHKAVWNDVQIEITYGQLTEIMKPKDLLVAVCTWDSGKTYWGAHLGKQCVKLSGKKLRHARAPIPNTKIDPLKAGQKVTFGMRMADGVLSALSSGKVRASTKDSPKFLKNVKPGRVGFVWNGLMVKGIILEIKITGEIDQDWLAKLK